MSDNHNEKGQFTFGNKASKGRLLGSRNRYTELVEQFRAKGYTAGQTALEIATDPLQPPELRLRADKVLSDAEVKLMLSEPLPEDHSHRSIEEIDQELMEWLHKCLPDDSMVIMTRERAEELLRIEANHR